jgi:hypothetical protein
LCERERERRERELPGPAIVSRNTVEQDCVYTHTKKNKRNNQKIPSQFAFLAPQKSNLTKTEILTSIGTTRHLSCNIEKSTRNRLIYVVVVVVVIVVLQQLQSKSGRKNKQKQQNTVA